MRRITVGILVLALFGCDQSFDAEQRLPDEIEAAMVAPAGMKNPAILPAHKLPGEEYVPGKQDAASDYRKAHPQWYAITKPPTGNFRPMKEWEPMAANLITYSNYLPSDNATAQTLADIAIHSVPVGEMWVVADSDFAKNDLISRMKAGGVKQSIIDEKVVFFHLENDAIWTIDFGPLPLVNEDTQTVAFSDFRYYHPRVYDDAIPTRLGNAIGITTYRSPFDYEGGNFQADGDEFCYFSERVYLYTGLSFGQVQEIHKTHYGCKESVVLKDITNDGTGHIDMFFKLGAKNVAFVGDYTTVKNATNDARMEDNVEIITSLSYSDGSPSIKVYRIPFPNPGGSGGEKIPRTYINSTLFVSADGTKKVNLWPMYTVDKELEAEALDAWEEGLPDFDHIGIVSDQISIYSGAIHCVTRTIPALPFEKWVADGQCEDGACNGPDGGYDGACIPTSEEDPGCWGPEWACLCNHCEASGCSIPQSCGNGTCDAIETCFNCAKDCGCEGDTTCSMVAGECVSDTCGNGICDEGESCLICVPDCGCKGNEKCSYGICSDNPCDGIEYEGCCDGSTLVYCDAGDLVSVNCGGDGCGWLADKNWYDCGGNGADPSGKFLLDCEDHDYPPGCAGKDCGDNGGGYSCGSCPEDDACFDFQCGPKPDPCAGKECGDDGQGGSCGTCPEGEYCVEGLCVGGSDPCADKECGDDGQGGSCGTCEDGFECIGFKCIDPDCDPVVNCGDKECGDDGCGGVCGTCGEGFTCDQGACFEVVVESIETDLVVQVDVPATTDDSTVQEDAGGEEEIDDDHDVDDGCSAGPGGCGPGAGLLFLCLIAMLGLARRRARA